jgi:hypothetical protein
MPGLGKIKKAIRLNGLPDYILSKLRLQDRESQCCLEQIAFFTKL